MSAVFTPIERLTDLVESLGGTVECDTRYTFDLGDGERSRPHPRISVTLQGCRFAATAPTLRQAAARLTDTVEGLGQVASIQVGGGMAGSSDGRGAL